MRSKGSISHLNIEFQSTASFTIVWETCGAAYPDTPNKIYKLYSPKTTKPQALYRAWGFGE